MTLFTNKHFDKMLEGLQIQAAVLGKFSAGIVRESWKTAESKVKITALKKALSLMENCTGKVVVSSMGRFGKVAEIVSSTLSAVGTDSTFLHASEAIHGDELLVLQDNDLLLILSKNGNKKDLVTLGTLCQAKGIPVISICDDLQSALGDASEVTIELGSDYVELSVGDVTPTTSIALMLQICNSFAAALYHFNHVQGDKVVEERHPSSEFGTKEVSRVKDIMIEITPVPYSMSFDELASTLTESCREILFVSKEGNIVGQVSGKDISRAVNSTDSKAKLFTKVTALEVMNENVRYIPEETLTADAVEIMNLNKVTSLLVKTEKPGIYVVDLHSL